MAKDKGGHGSESRGGSTADRMDAARKAQGYKPLSRTARGFNDFLDNPSGHIAAAGAHSQGVQQVGRPQAGVKMMGDGSKQVTIKHQDGEYAIPNGVGHTFESDKGSAEDTARAIHGNGITIKHRAASWGPEMN
jgi:hypothetical protein